MIPGDNGSFQFVPVQRIQVLVEAFQVNGQWYRDTMGPGFSSPAANRLQEELNQVIAERDQLQYQLNQAEMQHAAWLEDVSGVVQQKDLEIQQHRQNHQQTKNELGAADNLTDLLDSKLQNLRQALQEEKVRSAQLEAELALYKPVR